MNTFVLYVSFSSSLLVVLLLFMQWFSLIISINMTCVLLRFSQRICNSTLSQIMYNARKPFKFLFVIKMKKTKL